MQDLNDRIAQLEEELRKEKFKYQCTVIHQQTARQFKAEDARREMLVGAAVLVAVEAGELPRDKLMAILDRRLMRNEDRALFRLPPNPGLNPPQPKDNAGGQAPK